MNFDEDYGCVKVYIFNLFQILIYFLVNRYNKILQHIHSVLSWKRKIKIFSMYKSTRVTECGY